MSTKVTTPAPATDPNAWVYPTVMMALFILGTATVLFLSGQGLMAGIFVAAGTAPIAFVLARRAIRRAVAKPSKVSP